MLKFTTITGFPRTGTSILFDCFVANGYNGGPNINLDGNGTEDEIFKLLNVKLSLELGYVPLKCETKDGEKFSIADIVTNRNRIGNVSHELLRHCDEFVDYIERCEITILKDPCSAPSLPFWIDRYEKFKNAVFIRMTRNETEVGKSYVRLKVPRFTKYYRGNITTRKVAKIYRFYQDLLDNIDKNELDWYEFDLTDLLNNTKYVEDELGISLPLINKDHTFAEQGWKAVESRRTY